MPRTDDFLKIASDFNIAISSSGNDRVSGSDQADIVYSGDGDDRVKGGKGDDRLYGGEGGDYLEAGDGRDVLSGGGGNDLLYGQDGADVYLYGRGYGDDVVVDHSEDGWRQDSIRLLGLNYEDVLISVDPLENITITIRDTGETLYIPRFGDTWGENGA